jgi:alcohol dehydrogenase
VTAARREFVHVYPAQRVHFGDGLAGRLAPLLEEFSLERALLVCGANVGGNGQLLASLRDGAGGRIAGVYDGVRPHVPTETVDAAVERYREFGCDSIVSVGGGSSHDAARAVSLCLQTGRPLLDHFPEPERPIYWHGAERPPDAPAIVAIPTTLSAAETSFGGGVTYEHRKYVFVGHPLFVQHIVLDPAVAATTPLDLFLGTGMNAVNHAVERLAATNREPLGDAQFLHALRLLLPALERLRGSGGDDRGALGDALLGAHLSMSTNVRGGIGHAIPHVLGGRYGIGHGVANGVAMPYAAELNGTRDPGSLDLVADELIRQGRLDAGAATPEGVAAALAAFVRGLGLPHRLRDLGVPREDVPGIAVEVVQDFSAATLGIPVEDVQRLLERAW